MPCFLTPNENIYAEITDWKENFLDYFSDFYMNEFNSEGQRLLLDAAAQILVVLLRSRLL